MSDQAQIKLPEPHLGQLKFLKSKAKRRVLMCGRRWGKSLICKSLAIERALKKQLVAYVTPTFALGKVFFKELLEVVPFDIIAESNTTDLYLKFITGGSIRFFTGEAIDNFRGHKFHIVILDEAAYIKNLKSVFDEAIQPTLSDFNGDAVFISTPRGQGDFYQYYMRGYNYEKHWESFRYTTYDNPFISKEVINEAKSELPELVFSQEYLAVPQANASNPFGNHIMKNVITDLSKKRSVSFGIDVAKSIDWSVIIGLDDVGYMSMHKRWQSDWNDTKMKIKELPRSIDKLLDTSGVGEVIYDELRYDVANLHSFKFTSATKPQLIKELILAVEQGKVKYTQEVANEMLHFEYIYNPSNGYIKYQSQVGNNLHDDQVIALALAWRQFNKRTRRSNNWCIGTA